MNLNKNLFKKCLKVIHSVRGTTQVTYRKMFHLFGKKGDASKP